MTVLYRALWASRPASTPEYLARTRALFSAWATESPDGEAIEDGVGEVELKRTQRSGEHDAVSRSIRLRSVGDLGSPNGWEGTTSETAEGMTWTTLVRVIEDGGVAQVWVENQAESDRLVGVRLQVGRPRVVDDLLSASERPYLGGSNLQIEPLSVPRRGIPILVDHLRSPERTLHTIVVSEPNGGDDGAWLRRATRIARRVVGVATVTTIDREAVTAFSKTLGQLATWDGSIRVYARFHSWTVRATGTATRFERSSKVSHPDQPRSIGSSTAYVRSPRVDALTAHSRYSRRLTSSSSTSRATSRSKTLMRSSETSSQGWKLLPERRGPPPRTRTSCRGSSA